MAKKEIALEFKDRHLTRPDLDQIVGAKTRAVPDASEIIVRCRSAARTVSEAVDSYDNEKITIVTTDSRP
ncbi:hypothetical protein [Spirulina subsalsa]|uniref:hypothetical protein n=1 Tax=Spirulina subsalsa TaxID=54311 RepID=UPI00035DEDFA|nr:hypothetical protein [Spirulina subsalsa]